MYKIIFICLIHTTLFSFSLNQYIQLSLENSNDAKLLNDNELSLKLDYELQQNKFSSSYSPSSYFNANDDSNTLSLGIQRDQKNQYGGSLYNKFEVKRSDYDEYTQYTPKFSIGYKQALLQKFGKQYNTNSLDRAKENFDLFKLIKVDTEADIIIKAVVKYYNYTLSESKITIQEQALSRAEKNYKAAQAKYKSGIVSKIDVHRAKLSFLDQKKNLKETLKQHKDSLDELYYYINQDTKKVINKSDIEVIKEGVREVSHEELLGFNLRWNEMLLNERFSKRDLYNIKKEFLPDLELDLGYTFQSSETQLSDSFDFDENQWSVGVSSNYNFNTTAQDIKYKKAKIYLNRLQRDKDALQREILKEINALKNDYLNTKENLEIYQLKQIESKNSLEIAQIRYNRGLSSNLDILDAEAVYSQSQVEYMNELVRHNIAFLKLVKALGYLDRDFIKRIYE